MQNFTEMAQESSEKIFTGFVFAEQMCNARTKPLPVDCHTLHVNLATQRNNEVKKQAGVKQLSLPFAWRISHFTNVSGLSPLSNSFGASLMASLASCIAYAGYSYHLGGRQTVENYFVHTGT